MTHRTILVFVLFGCTPSAPRTPAASVATAKPPATGRKSCPPGTRRILSQNRYWAKPGKGDEVFAWRQHATDVQVEMGMPRGLVFRGPGGDAPDAIWQLEVPPDQDQQVQRAQDEHMDLFRPVMEHMDTLLRHFEATEYCELEHVEE